MYENSDSGRYEPTGQEPAAQQETDKFYGRASVPSREGEVLPSGIETDPFEAFERERFEGHLLYEQELAQTQDLLAAGILDKVRAGGDNTKSAFYLNIPNIAYWGEVSRTADSLLSRVLDLPLEAVTAVEATVRVGAADDDVQVVQGRVFPLTNELRLVENTTRRKDNSGVISYWVFRFPEAPPSE